jgi:general secretion pathway protein B
MSLILEALKKAERQHKLGEVPGISGHTPERQAKRSGWMVWVSMALFAAVMLGAGLYLGGLQTKPQVQPATPPAAPPISQTEQASQHEGELSERPQRPLSTNTPPPGPVNTENVSSPSTIAEPQPAKVEVDSTPPPEPPPPQAIPLNEMPSGFVSNLPAMNIDIHSYDPRPANRYVLINMEKYHEGDYLAEGPQLIEIQPDGVIMEHMGARFILPINNN